MKLFPLSVFFLFSFPCLASVVITTTTLPAGTADVPFSAVLNASGGCTPYKWALVSGSLPRGISERPSSNTKSLDFTGTPTAAGTYSFTISVTGCGGYVSKKSYTVVIEGATNYYVDLSWNASTSSEVVGYNIYRSNGSAWEKINTSLIVSNEYDDSTIAAGHTYYYAATAVNTEGIESAKSTIAEAVIP